MESYTRDNFRRLLETAIERTIEAAQPFVADLLPPGRLLVLDAFQQGRRESTIDEILPYLYRDGAFPRVVVVGLRGIVDDKCLVAILPSGHAYVRDHTRTWNQPPEMGPFNCVGLMLRGHISVWNMSQPVSLQDLKVSGALWKR